ncbi:hypothetical protein MBRA1_002688 [Malassezia brasiliensis]|uniref:F-box domain-containing protein n=1 Tax=Malassezia brasiliensis TaxID=1821822 RepID=A0AAF0IPE4_9BASI|nr:hypothetical protein MBRA1_002688 [Malassezia brasiliensis]
MDALPPELLARVLGALDPCSLARAGCVCRTWHDVGMRDTVWASVARAAHYTDTHDVRSAVQHYQHSAPFASAAAYFDTLHSFRELCAKRHMLDVRWGTRAAPHADLATTTRALRPHVRYYRPSGAREDVWRIQLDPQENCLLESHVGGGVRAVDTHTGHVLWHSDPTDARPYPHLEFDNGWLVFDRDAPGHFEVWRSARLVPDAPEAQRGAFVRYAILDVPELVRAYRLQFPTLAFVTIFDTYAELDVRTKSLVRRVPLGHTLHGHRNIHYIEFDDDYLFLVGYGANRVSAVRRDTGAVVWTLAEHIQRHGAPHCYRSVPRATGERHALLLREQQRTPAPRWLAQLAHRAADDPAQLCYAWHAVHFDRVSHTLVVLGESGLLLVPNYRAVLAGEPPTQPLRMHLFATERDVPPSDGDVPPFHRRPRTEMHGQLSVANGRVAAVYETLTVLDLHAQTHGCDTDGQRIEVPFAVYEWSDPPNAFDWFTGPIDQFRGCSCIKLDATSLYCVTRQALDREINVSPDDFPPGYQAECLHHDSSMVTAFHFDDRAQPPEVLDHAAAALPPPPQLDHISLLSPASETDADAEDAELEEELMSPATEQALLALAPALAPAWTSEEPDSSNDTPTPEP